MSVRNIVISFGILGFITGSCNNDQEKSSGNNSGSENNSVSVPQSPAMDTASLEYRLFHDSLNINLRMVLAAKYYSAGELSKAAFHFLIINRQDPDNLIALINLGNIYYDNLEDDKAISFYEKALVHDAGNINMRCDLATCYSRINKFKKAIMILNENIKMDYNHKQSHYNLSVILKQVGKVHEAEEEMKIFNLLNSGI